MLLISEQSRQASTPNQWYVSPLVAFICFAMFSTTVQAVSCPAPQPLGPSPTRLVVVVPATGQGPGQWSSFLEALQKETQSRDLAWLIFDHGISYTSLGSARDISITLASCIDEKVKANDFKQVTLIGHSVGGMLVRRAYLEAAGAFPGQEPPPDSWTDRVDRILLFASVNKGVRPAAKWWGQPANWLLRTLPHPRFVFEDLMLGSDFIADVRIAWIRHFGALNQRANDLPPAVPPRVVQFWGTKDSIVTAHDNADIQAFSGRPVIIYLPDSTHGNLQRLDKGYAADPASRWAIFRQQLLGELPPIDAVRNYSPQRVLFIVRGIRDSSNSEWVSDLRRRAKKIYGDNNIEDVEYGYFSAAHFALRPLREKIIPMFRDLYAQRLAENPLTEFDFIGHSNGTYILGHSLLSTPSMRFRNVVLAAPVLPTDFNWRQLFQFHQVAAVRYDTAMRDWPVGILCPMLRALGFQDVGPSGVVLFGEGTMDDARVKKVGWYDGDHSAALRVDPTRGVDNLQHLLSFATDASDLSAGETMKSELGAMRHFSRATQYVVWAFLAFMVWLLFWLYRTGKFSRKSVAWTAAILFSIYAFLDFM